MAQDLEFPVSYRNMEEDLLRRSFLSRTDVPECSTLPHPVDSSASYNTSQFARHLLSPLSGEP